MAIYFRTITEADDPYQTPGDVGNDLDQIEEDICGPDGIEGHRDEVEDATEGMIGDPVEEAYYIMFEMNTNLNNIMNAIGISELSEAAMGRQLVLEAVDVKAFITKVIDSLKKAFAKVVNFFNKLINDIAGAISVDKAYIRKNGDALKKAWNCPWSVNGYKNLLTYEKVDLNDVFGVMAAITSIDIKNIEDEEDEEKLQKSLDDDAKTKRNEFIDLVSEKFGVKPNEKGKIDIDTLKSSIYGEKSKITSSDIRVDRVIALLQGDKESTEIKRQYQFIKKCYDHSIKAMGMISKNKYAPSLNVKLAKLTGEMLTYSLSSLNAVYAVVCKALKDKRALYRTIAGAALGHVAGNPKTESPAAETADKAEPANESGRVYTAPFTNLSII